MHTWVNTMEKEPIDLSQLFCPIKNDPMKFIIVQDKILNVEVERVLIHIEGKGGQFMGFDPEDNDCIILASSKYKPPQNLTVFDIKYIKKCVKAQKLLDLKDFLLSGEKICGPGCFSFEKLAEPDRCCHFQTAEQVLAKLISFKVPKRPPMSIKEALGKICKNQTLGENVSNVKQGETSLTITQGVKTLNITQGGTVSNATQKGKSTISTQEGKLLNVTREESISTIMQEKLSNVKQKEKLSSTTKGEQISSATQKVNISDEIPIQQRGEIANAIQERKLSSTTQGGNITNAAGGGEISKGTAGGGSKRKIDLAQAHLLIKKRLESQEKMKEERAIRKR